MTVKELGSKKRMEISIVCYANVSSLFATFVNPKARGPNFSWEWFIDWCEKSAKNWMFIHDVKGHKASVNALATQTSRDIAESMVMRMTE